MHPRNRHQSRYNLKELASASPELRPYLFINQYGIETIDFSDAKAVKALNRALLKGQYGIKYWDIPDEFLCPPIPGRADYIHSVADLFTEKEGLHVLDVGVGANCIYPLIGLKEYKWSFVGSDVSKKALSNALTIIEKNRLTSKIELRFQKDKTKIFTNIILPEDRFDLTICNPPFHESQKDAQKGSERKWTNLGKKPAGKLNFGGNENELWYPGGEKAFVTKMITESKLYQDQVTCFTTLVSKEKNVMPLLKILKKENAQADVIDMGQGSKKSRLLFWGFLKD